MNATAGRLAVIGIGNPDRGDDGAGPAVIRALEEAGPPAHVKLTRLGGDLLALLDCFDGVHAAVLVDATRSGALPGTIRRLDASQRRLGAEAGTFVSTHAMSLADVVELGRSLGRLPPVLKLYGIEAQRLDTGTPLTAPVAAAVAAVAGEITALAAGGS